MPPPAPRLPGISVREAAARLGTSDSDVRRRVRRGELEGAYFDRPGGTILRVILDAPEAPPATPVVIETPAPSTPATDAPPLTTGLLEIVAADRETIRAKDATIAALYTRLSALEREAGRLEGRATAAEQQVRDQAEQLRGLRAELVRARRGLWQRIRDALG